MKPMLEFLCVDLHNQFNNVINQCYLFFALWSIMGLDTYCCLIFYGLTLIHLTGPLSQVVQLKCVMCNIYIYIYRGVCAFGGGPLSLLFSLKNTPGHTRTHPTLDWILGIKGKSSLIVHPRSITHPESRLLDIKGSRNGFPKHEPR